MSKQITHEEFVYQLSLVNKNIDVVGNYVSKRSNIKVRCKIDGHEWEGNAYYLLKGVGCPVCGGCCKIKHEDFVEKVKSKHDNFEILSEYKNAKTKVKLRCKIDGHEWEGLPANVSKDNYNCPKCSGKVSFNKSEYFAEMLKRHKNIEIVGEYKKNNIPVKLRCKIDGHEWCATPTNSLKRNSGCPKCAGNISHTQESYEKLMKEKHPNITVVGEYVRFHDAVALKCSCGYEWSGIPSVNIGGRGGGCPACCPSPKVAWEGNCIAKKEPWMLEYFLNKEDGFKYLPASNKRVDMICPCCQTIKRNCNINTLYYKRSIGCKKCSDGRSYGERFLYELLNQLNVEFESEKTFSWGVYEKSKKRYDFYIPSLNMIIETHGIQHYKETYGVFRKTLEEEQENDRLKERLAKENGVDHYVVVDCMYSNFEWIKSSISSCNLSKFFDLSNIDWIECEKSTATSLVYKVCEFKNNNPYSSISDISRNFKLCNITVGKYLKKGNEIGICAYNQNLQKIISLKKTTMERGKKIHVFGLNKNYVKTFCNITQLINHSKDELGIKLYGKGIRKAIAKNRTYNGFYYCTEENINELGLCLPSNTDLLLCLKY